MTRREQRALQLIEQIEDHCMANHNNYGIVCPPCSKRITGIWRIVDGEVITDTSLWDLV